MIWLFLAVSTFCLSSSLDLGYESTAYPGKCDDEETKGISLENKRDNRKSKENDVISGVAKRTERRPLKDYRLPAPDIKGSGVSGEYEYEYDYWSSQPEKRAGHKRNNPTSSKVVSQDNEFTYYWDIPSDDAVKIKADRLDRDNTLTLFPVGRRDYVFLDDWDSPSYYVPTKKIDKLTPRKLDKGPLKNKGQGLKKKTEAPRPKKPFLEGEKININVNAKVKKIPSSVLKTFGNVGGTYNSTKIFGKGASACLSSGNKRKPSLSSLVYNLHKRNSNAKFKNSKMDDLKVIEPLFSAGHKPTSNYNGASESVRGSRLNPNPTNKDNSKSTGEYSGALRKLSLFSGTYGSSFLTGGKIDN